MEGVWSMIVESERLYLREMKQSDYKALCKMLQDNEVMYAYEGAFSDEESQNWLTNQMTRYQKNGFGLWAVILKESGEMIGQCGLTIQNVKDSQVLEIGYLFQKKYWHQGYAIEAATLCKDYAFEVLNYHEVYSIIRDNNIASQKVALRNGMIKVDTITKHYKGVDMPHFVYCIRR